MADVLMVERVELDGAERLASTLAAAAVELARLDKADVDAGKAVARYGRGTSPKRTGRLARSVAARRTGGGAEVFSKLIYAPVIHWGWPNHNITANPFLLDALEAARPEVVTIYAAGAERVLARVKGA